MNGTFFSLDTSTNTIGFINGKYLSHYNETWVLSKEPERLAGATYGSVNEWRTLYDLQTESWMPVPAKGMSAPGVNLNIVNATIVDVNVVGAFVDYVVQYKATSGQCLYYRDRNIDSVFTTENYSVYNSESFTESILGSYANEESYIKTFNNSVMLYSNIRMNLLGNSVVSYSYAVTSRRIGTILIPFGDLQEDYIPGEYFDSQKQYIVSKTGTGLIRITRLGDAIPNRIKRMAQYVHKINTVDVINILIEREERIVAEPGSLDWNNKFIINNNIIDTEEQEKTTYHVNSGYNPLFEVTGKRSSSMLASDTTFTLYGKLFTQKTDDGYNLNFINANINESIDVFYDTVQPSKYKYSIVNGTQRFNTRYEDMSFPLGVIVPFPVGTKWSMQNEVIAVGEMSLELLAAGLVFNNKTLELYDFSNQVYFGQDSFILFGVQYFYDGDYVYQGSERIAMAFGYNFIGCDNNSAYFYNRWDKSIYQFNGSRNLNKFLSLTNRSSVITGRFDGFSGEMVLITENEILKNRENVIMNFLYAANVNSRNVIIPTKHGPYVELENGERLLLSPINNDSDIFEIQTAFIGIDGSTVCDYDRIDIRFYSPEKTPLSFTVEMQTINQDTKESEHKMIEIKGGDWSIDGYKTIKLIPQYKKGTGLSLRVYSEQELFISEIEFTYDPVSRTANSQRSGF